MHALELAARAATIRVGRSLLDALLSAQDGHSGQRIDCGPGHRAEFVGYRGKGIDTVMDPVRLRRAYYPCRACQRGVRALDGDLAVAHLTFRRRPGAGQRLRVRRSESDLLARA
jgi:hypothetical protein